MAISNLRQRNIFDQFGGGMDYMSGNPFDDQKVDFPSGYYPDPPTASSFPVDNSRPIDMGRNVGLSSPSMVSNVSERPDYTQRVLDMISQQYTPETEARDRYNNLLNQVPQMEEPSLGKRLVGATAFLGNRSRGIPGGYDVQDKVMNAPYYRDMAAWKEQTVPFGQAAQNENARNINERTLVGNVVTSMTAADRQAEQSRIADARQQEVNRSNKANEDIRMIHAKAADLRARGFKTFIDGNRVKASNPQGQLIDLGPSTGMTQYDEIVLKGAQQIEASRVQGEAAAGRATQAGAIGVQNPDGSWSVINPRAPEQGTTPIPGSQGVTRPGITPSTVKERNEIRQEALNNIWTFAPVEYRRFIQQNEATGEFTLKPRPAGSDGYEWDKVAKTINPGYVGPPPPPSNVPYKYGMAPQGQPPSFTPSVPPPAPVAPPTGGRGGGAGPLGLGVPQGGVANPNTMNSYRPPAPPGAAPPAPQTANQGPPPAVIHPPIPPGKIRVMDQNGNYGFASATWTDAQLKAEGYTRVK